MVHSSRDQKSRPTEPRGQALPPVQFEADLARALATELIAGHEPEPDQAPAAAAPMRRPVTAAAAPVTRPAEAAKATPPCEQAAAPAPAAPAPAARVASPTSPTPFASPARVAPAPTPVAAAQDGDTMLLERAVTRAIGIAAPGAAVSECRAVVTAEQANAWTKSSGSAQPSQPAYPAYVSPELMLPGGPGGPGGEDGPASHEAGPEDAHNGDDFIGAPHFEPEPPSDPARLPSRSESAQARPGASRPWEAAPFQSERPSLLRDTRRVWMGSAAKRAPHTLAVISLRLAPMTPRTPDATAALRRTRQALDEALGALGTVYAVAPFAIAVMLPDRALHQATRIAEAVKATIDQQSEASSEPRVLIACGLATLHRDDDPTTAVCLAEHCVASAEQYDESKVLSEVSPEARFRARQAY